MHRENIKKIANALTISENDIQYEDQYKSYTIDEKKEIIIKDEFGDIQIDIPVKFYKCHIKFNNDNLRKDININLEFYECKFINTKIISCNFNKQIYFKECEFLISEDKLDYINEIYISSKFLSDVDFSDTKFNHSVNFVNSMFYNDINFRNTKFESGVNFKHSKFNGNIDFSNTIFKDNVYFNNSIFEDYADFHECEFEKVACFYGVEFKKVPNFSQAKFIGNLDPVNMKMDFNMSGIKKSIKKAKKILENKNNNNEKEDYKFANDFRDSFRVFKSALIKDNNLLEASRFHKYELYAKEIELDYKENKTLKEKIDYWQLVFYRKLCEHHTDLLLNLKWLVIAIGLFASLYFISRSIQDIGILEFLNTFGACFSIACTFIMLILCCFGCKSRHKRLNVFASIGTVITLLAIYYKPQLIFGIANLFGDTKYNGLENFLITIYTIVIGLIIFSLQKTARKNSIVPN